MTSEMRHRLVRCSLLATVLTPHDRKLVVVELRGIWRFEHEHNGGISEGDIVLESKSSTGYVRCRCTHEDRRRRCSTSSWPF
jgi:hypothetical protein